MVTENNYKYLTPPTIEQIDAALKKAGVNGTQFERFHNIYFGCIRQVRMGFRDMPSQHWHLFFEPQNHVSKNAIPKRPKTAKQRTKVDTSGRLSDLVL